MNKMIPTVKERKENVNKFGLCYEDICKIQNRMSLPFVKAHLKNNILDFNGDRITYEEWGPILNALSLDRSLHFIGVRSTRSAKTALEDVTTESKARALERIPVLQTRHVLLLLMKSIGTCMCNTQMLTCMELEGLPLGPDYLNELIKGITNCKSLQNISLHRSPIGDEGCELMCRTIKGITNIVSIDFSNCGLTEQGALAVAETLKYQKIQRYSESWKQTLRYREPDLNSLPGLRRVTLNHNVEIRDQGALHLMDVAKDDLFLKALDLQNCGVGNTGGKAALEVLESNLSLAIVDLRANRDLSPDLLKMIMKQLHVNNQGAPQEYHWIAVDRFQLPRQPLRRTLTIRPRSQPPIKKAVSVKLDASAGAPKRSKSSVPTKGVPWRVSVRLDRRRKCAEVSPGTPRALQYQELYPPYRMATPPPTPRCLELERAKQQMLWLSEQLNNEMVKRRQAEEEKMVLQQRLEDLLGQNCVVLEKQTMAAIQQSFDDFQNLMQKLRDTGLSGLLDVDILDSLGKLNTDHKGRLAFLIRKSYSTHATRDKSNQTDLHKVSKSASTFRDIVTGRDLPVQRVERGVGDSASIRVHPTDHNVVVSSEGTVGTLTCQECSSDSVGASMEDSDGLMPQDHLQLAAGSRRSRVHRTTGDTKERKRGRKHEKYENDTIDILYQTVLNKNKEIDSARLQSVKASKGVAFKNWDTLMPLEAPTDAVLNHQTQRGSTTSSSSSVTTIPEETGVASAASWTSISKSSARAYQNEDDLF